ncbi:hypothetical protein RFM26_21090 [Mesorhizobium sp. VK23B]|uniref:DUF1488 family protein n=1 Tax=Mesorhizobium dulcispinae TaxID=3072316 RepID=A0ABU4XIE4_9HYPH|nr:MULTISPECIES: hypothetical protein [unclassified Mesorhizobium]MDX8468198.1 hypothetical protein [Mesorhizobium sp. VK23B]MDX8474536.1 hypothetical protein [Mesorhizobium sp. VK23A]
MPLIFTGERIESAELDILLVASDGEEKVHCMVTLAEIEKYGGLEEFQRAFVAKYDAGHLKPERVRVTPDLQHTLRAAPQKRDLKLRPGATWARSSLAFSLRRPSSSQRY